MQTPSTTRRPEPTYPTGLKPKLLLATTLLVVSCASSEERSLCAEAEAHIASCADTPSPSGTCTESAAKQILELSCDELTNQSGKSDLFCRPELSWAGYCSPGESVQDRGDYADLIARVLVRYDHQSGSDIPRNGAEEWIRIENELHASGENKIFSAELDIAPNWLGDYGTHRPFRLSAAYGTADQSHVSTGCTSIVADGRWELTAERDVPQDFHIDRVTAFTDACDTWAGARDVTEPTATFTSTTPSPHNLELFQGPFEIASWWNIERWEHGNPPSNDRTEGSDAARRCARALLVRLEALWNHEEPESNKRLGGELLARLSDDTEWDGTRLSVIVEDMSLGGTAIAGPGRIATVREGGVNAGPDTSALVFHIQAQADGICELPTLASLETFVETCAPLLRDPATDGHCATTTQ